MPKCKKWFGCVVFLKTHTLRHKNAVHQSGEIYARYLSSKSQQCTSDFNFHTQLRNMHDRMTMSILLQESLFV